MRDIKIGPGDTIHLMINNDKELISFSHTYELGYKSPLYVALEALVKASRTYARWQSPTVKEKQRLREQIKKARVTLEQEKGLQSTLGVKTEEQRLLGHPVEKS